MQTAMAQAADMAWVPDAKAVAMSVPPRLLAVLQAEIARSGPEGAIATCREQAPAMAREASEKSGWAVRRVSLRNRNPKAVPDAWERAVLEDFDRRAAAGESPATLERAGIVQANGQAVQRYMRALPTAELCTNCHGTRRPHQRCRVGAVEGAVPRRSCRGLPRGRDPRRDHAARRCRPRPSRRRLKPAATAVGRLQHARCAAARRPRRARAAPATAGTAAPMCLALRRPRRATRRRRRPRTRRA